jgi:dTDP-4-amino-4,6-dideoxygalactose transaminase
MSRRSSDIRFNVPWRSANELGYLADAMSSGKTGGDGIFTEQCQSILKKRTGASAALLTTSCTAALEMAALLLNIGPEDEVIIPAFTFPSTATAFALRGARLVFADIRQDTLNIDEQHVKTLISHRTRAIVPVHYAGIPSDLDKLQGICQGRDIALVEDAAQGCGAMYKHRPLGAIGKLGAISFHESKNIGCGEGGALLVNSDDLVRRAEIIRQKGTNRAAWKRGDVQKYSWVDLGSSYALSEVLAAYLLGQLEDMQTVIERRRRIFNSYLEALSPLQDRGILILPTIPPDCSPSYHIFYVLLRVGDRNSVLDRLAEDGVQAAFHYIPLHPSEMGRRLNRRAPSLPVTELVSEQLIRLPMHAYLTEEDVSVVSRALHDAVGVDVSV